VDPYKAVGGDAAHCGRHGLSGVQGAVEPVLGRKGGGDPEGAVLDDDRGGRASVLCAGGLMGHKSDAAAPHRAGIVQEVVDPESHEG
jgi:hypothetical protein